MGNLYNHEQELQKDLRSNRVTVNEATLVLLASAIAKVNNKVGDLPGNSRMEFTAKNLLKLAAEDQKFLWSCEVNDAQIAALLHFRDIHYNNQPRIVRAIKGEIFGGSKQAQG